MTLTFHELRNIAAGSLAEWSITGHAGATTMGEILLILTSVGPKVSSFGDGLDVLGAFLHTGAMRYAEDERTLEMVEKALEHAGIRRG